LIEVNGQTRLQKKQDAARGQMIGGVMVVIMIVFYLAIQEYQSDGDKGDSDAAGYEQVPMLEIPERRTSRDSQ
jgi:hypothetical protein